MLSFKLPFRARGIKKKTCFCNLYENNFFLGQEKHDFAFSLVCMLSRSSPLSWISTSQKAGLTGLYKKFLFMSTTAISKPVFQEVDGTVILPLTFIKE
jgi:hypothetical protein